MILGNLLIGTNKSTLYELWNTEAVLFILHLKNKRAEQ